MPDEDDIDLEGLKRQTSHGDRLDSDADNDQQQELADAILTELERINAGEEQKTICIWDGPTSAFVRALDEQPEQRAEVGKSLRHQLDIDEEGEINGQYSPRMAYTSSSWAYTNSTS